MKRPGDGEPTVGRRVGRDDGLTLASISNHPGLQKKDLVLDFNQGIRLRVCGARPELKPREKVAVNPGGTLAKAVSRSAQWARNR